MKNKTVRTITPSHISLDTRAQRFNQVFHELGFKIDTIHNFGSQKQSSKTTKNKSIYVTQKARVLWRQYIKSNQKIIQFLFAPIFATVYIILMLYFNLVKTKLTKNDIIIIHGNFYSIHALISKFLFKTKIIVDTHDLYSALTLNDKPNIFEKYYKIPIDEYIARKIYKHSDLRITVSNSLSTILQTRYLKSFCVIRNCTDMPLEIQKIDQVNKKVNTSDKLNGIFIGNNKQGLTLEWLNDKKWFGSNVNFHFYGEKYENEKILENNHTVVHPPVDFNLENFDFAFYDFAFFPYSIDHANIQVALPNGFFMLARAGLPCLLPINGEFKEINSQFNLGIFVNYYDSVNVYEGIETLVNNYCDYTKSIYKFRETFSWQSEKRIFIDLLLSEEVI